LLPPRQRPLEFCGCRLFVATSPSDILLDGEGTEGMNHRNRARLRAASSPTHSHQVARPGTSEGIDENRTSLRRRSRYWIDRQFDRGTAVLVRLLGLATVAIVAAAALVIVVGHIAANSDLHPSFGEAFWQDLLRAIDPGTMGSDVGWGFRLVSLVVTIAGIFVVSALIGLLATGIERRLAELQRGRSPVIETGHTVILGWCDRMVEVARELAVAAENQRRACLVVVAEMDKVEMDAALRNVVPKGSPLRVVCRTGDPGSLDTLRWVGVHDARAVIIPRQAEANDADAVRRALAVIAVGMPDTASIVVELDDREVAATLVGATGGRVLTIVSDDVVARITSEICCSSGISDVAIDLLDFDGDEIYFQHEPRLTGGTFGQAVMAYPESTPIGIRRADGRIEIAPPMAAIFEPGDLVIAIAEDDDRIVLPPLASLDGPAPPIDAIDLTESERHLVIAGWSELGPILLAELDHRLPRNSVIDLVYDARFVDPSTIPQHNFQRFELRIREGDTTDLEVLRAALNDSAIPPDRILVMAYREGLDRIGADARTILSVLQLRQHLAPPDLPIAAELRLRVNSGIVPTVATDDVIIGDRLSTLILTQVAENRELSRVFEELFGADGANFLAVDPVRFGCDGSSKIVGQLVERGAGHEMILIGLRLGGRVFVNPPKAREVELGSSPDDLIYAISTQRSMGSSTRPDDSAAGVVPVG
jgi:hypothetical protein